MVMEAKGLSEIGPQDTGKEIRLDRLELFLLKQRFQYTDPNLETPEDEPPRSIRNMEGHRVVLGHRKQPALFLGTL